LAQATSGTDGGLIQAAATRPIQTTTAAAVVVAFIVEVAGREK
jgi:hypothetical protein